MELLIASLLLAVGSGNNGQSPNAGGLVQCQSTVASLNAQVSTLTLEVSTLAGQVAALSEQLSACTGQVGTCNNNLTTCTGQVMTCTDNLTTCNAELASCQSQTPVCSCGYPQRPGTVEYWQFDTVSGTSTPDSSSTANTGALVNGPARTVGHCGTGLLFDGTLQYVSAGNANLPAGSSPRTIEAWARIDGNKPNGYGGYVAGYGANNTAAGFYMVESCVFTTGCPANGPSYLAFLGNNDDYSPLAGPNLRDGNWHHLAISYDGAQLAGYVDGTQVWPPIAWTVNTDVASNSTDIAPGIGIFMGYMNGALDEVRVVNAALSPAEIAADAAH